MALFCSRVNKNCCCLFWDKVELNVAEIKHVRFDVPDVGKNSVRLFQYHAGPPIHSIQLRNFLCYVPHCKTGRRRRRRKSKIQQHFVLFLNIETIWRCTVNDVKATNETWSKSHLIFCYFFFFLLLSYFRPHLFHKPSSHPIRVTTLPTTPFFLLAHFDCLLKTC